MVGPRAWYLLLERLIMRVLVRRRWSGSRCARHADGRQVHLLSALDTSTGMLRRVAMTAGPAGEDRGEQIGVEASLAGVPGLGVQGVGDEQDSVQDANDEAVSQVAERGAWLGKDDRHGELHARNTVRRTRCSSSGTAQLRYRSGQAGTRLRRGRGRSLQANQR